MKEIIYVNTGEVVATGNDVILNSGAIGSCVVITAYCPIKNVGVMAHVMLPGTALPKNKLYATRYASNAIEALLKHLSLFDVRKENLEICLIGGANVLKRENDDIGKNNIDSIENILDEKGIDVCSRAIGGFDRRTVEFDIEMGVVYFSEGDLKQRILWQTNRSQ